MSYRTNALEPELPLPWWRVLWLRFWCAVTLHDYRGPGTPRVSNPAQSLDFDARSARMICEAAGPKTSPEVAKELERCLFHVRKAAECGVSSLLYKRKNEATWVADLLNQELDKLGYKAKVKGYVTAETMIEW